MEWIHQADRNSIYSLFHTAETLSIFVFSNTSTIECSEALLVRTHTYTHEDMKYTTDQVSPTHRHPSSILCVLTRVHPVYATHTQMGYRAKNTLCREIRHSER